MTDEKLFIFVVALVEEALPLYGVTNAQVVRNEQPQHQGANTAPTIYVHKISDQIIGTPFIVDEYQEGDEQFQHDELQQYATTVQLSAVSDEVPGSMTASDLLNIAYGIIASEYAMMKFREAGIGRLNVSLASSPYVTNDRGENEAEPTLSLVITHKRRLRNVVPKATPVFVGVYRV